MTILAAGGGDDGGGGGSGGGGGGGGGVCPSLGSTRPGSVEGVAHPHAWCCLAHLSDAAYISTTRNRYTPTARAIEVTRRTTRVPSINPSGAEQSGSRSP